ncbi:MULTISPECIES: DnaA regulatory inactivator Hda [unclassified Thalassotalea]|uniref:DnaA regulatory inactivator Hda n=1 Tax=unclassified Thalassotalea TaxID=2614972 RepID=UPI0010818AD8|nr:MULTISPECIES: DnaA regulatory inactivator Hda [unclassified Thalassotalea]NMP16727.1 DnaA regulatory inactivator Hda [Thalassotalea sp. Y01]QBY05610.1 DnaA regulatory inactivator Hda [Thalassotalea sp. HSM 43]
MPNTEQLPLAVHLPDDETFTSFYSLDSGAIVSQLKAFIKSDDHSTHGFYLFGQHSVGKSHLLHASSAFASQLGKSSLCVSLSEIKHLSVEVLNNLEQVDLICLDDLHLIAGNKAWQQGIFDLYNRVIENNKKIILAGNNAANSLLITLPDLVSRISWGFTEQVKPLPDEDKVQAFQHRARGRGIEMQDETVKFLLNRVSRDMNSLLESLDVLDKASITAQRKITIPFIKEVLF